MKHSHSVGHFLRQGELSELTQHVLRLQKLQKLLPELLPSELADHCQAVAINHGCLVLEVSNGSAATFLRYYSPTLLSHLRKQSDFANIASIKQQVRPPSTKINRPTPIKRPHKGYSAKTALLLEHVADKIEYEPLKNALLKLAQQLQQDK